MTVTQTKNISNHGHDRQGAGKVGPAVKPDLAGRRLEQEKLGKIISGGLLEGVLKHLI